MQSDEESNVAWVIAGEDSKIKKYEVDTIARKIAGLKGQDLYFAADGFVHNVVATVDFSANSVVNKLSIGQADGDSEQYICSLSENVNYYLISKSSLSGILKSREDLLEK